MSTLFATTLRELLDKHQRADEGRDEWANHGAEGFMKWLARGCPIEGQRLTVERLVDASGGWQALGEALFGDRDQLLEAMHTGAPKLPNPDAADPGVSPHWIAMQAAIACARK